ncbi:MAG: rhodanese-like domain-containing protein [Pseudomonadales bacterium]|nr:rhodanese-like domain-containing protein [Pseudomonadales bacterium]
MTGRRKTQLMGFLFMLLSYSGVNAETHWFDVRSSLENAIDAIPGDVNVSYDEIVGHVEAGSLAKDSVIKVYCLSGGRAAKAVSALEQAGYTNVENVGSIESARSLRKTSAGE